MTELASFIVHINDDGTLTTSGFTPAEGVQHDQAVAAVQTAMPGSTVVPTDPWAESAPWPGSAQSVPPVSETVSPMQAYYQPPQPQPVAPSCIHGPLKVVPGGIAKTGPRAGQPYPPFWACTAPREQQCRLNKSALPPVPGG